MSKNTGLQATAQKSYHEGNRNRLLMAGHSNPSATVHDCVIDQNWAHYTPDEHETWRTLFVRQMDILRRYACEEYLEGLRMLGITADSIPDFDVMNKTLKSLTGWEVVAVPGLIPSKPFFDLLSERKFPAGSFIRRRDQLDYLEEPDVFHDVFGHVPLLTNPSYADYMHEYGKAGYNAMTYKGVKYLARLNWWTIEFGLIKKPEGIKIYGAGIASSFGETKYFAEDPSANFVQFDLARAMRTGYYIDDYQATYFVIDSFESLFKEAVEVPFVPLYQKFRTQEELTPFTLIPQDKVLRRGTEDYWRTFPGTKTKLK
jgi:phenylalanine-4-hydroxylase